MAKPITLAHEEWNTMVDAFHGESDRGAAVLMAGYVENTLGEYLHAVATTQALADELFSAAGPLGSFSQRITIAAAFGYISDAQYKDLTLLRKVRNHFAHHPLETSFATNSIRQQVQLMRGWKWLGQIEDPHERARMAYAVTCGDFVGRVHAQMIHSKAEGTRPGPLNWEVEEEEGEP